MTAVGPWDVEHYRPKGRVAERSDHPGYYWLAYEWTNLLPSCTFCNQKRRDTPRWGDLSRGPVGGKADQFPLADEATRCMTHDGDVEGEERLLLDPCRDAPEEHIAFGVDGSAVAVGGSSKGTASIAVYHLQREALRDERRRVAAFVVELVVAAPEKRREILDVLSDGGQAYAGVVRSIRRDPSAFGLPD